MIVHLQKSTLLLHTDYLKVKKNINLNLIKVNLTLETPYIKEAEKRSCFEREFIVF